MGPSRSKGAVRSRAPLPLGRQCVPWLGRRTRRRTGTHIAHAKTALAKLASQKALTLTAPPFAFLVPYAKSVCYASRLSASLSFFRHRFRWSCAAASRAYGCDGHRLLAGPRRCRAGFWRWDLHGGWLCDVQRGQHNLGHQGGAPHANPTRALALGQTATLTAVSACVAIEYPTRLARTLLKVV